MTLLDLAAPPLCWSCGASARGRPLCRGCLLELEWLPPRLVNVGGVRAWAPLAYRGPAQALVRALKFRGATRLADGMAAPIAACAPAGLLAGALVPVPLPESRRRRGFNQAERLAAALARRARLPMVHCLTRGGRVSPQARLRRAQRLANPAGTIGLRHGAIAPPAVVLVDDVITTGATLSACASALRIGGSDRIVAVAYARTPAR